MASRVITREEARMAAAFECLALDMAELNQAMVNANAVIERFAHLIKETREHRGE